MLFDKVNVYIVYTLYMMSQDINTQQYIEYIFTQQSDRTADSVRFMSRWEQEKWIEKICSGVCDSSIAEFFDFGGGRSIILEADCVTQVNAFLLETVKVVKKKKI